MLLHGEIIRVNAIEQGELRVWRVAQTCDAVQWVWNGSSHDRILVCKQHVRTSQTVRRQNPCFVYLRLAMEMEFSLFKNSLSLMVPRTWKVCGHFWSMWPHVSVTSLAIYGSMLCETKEQHFAV